MSSDEWKIEALEASLIAARAEAARLRAFEIENRGLRRRIHMNEKHNQLFERCESAWCNPDEKLNPARELGSCDQWPEAIEAAQEGGEDLMTSKPRLAWRKQPRERGLAAICQGERGYELRLAGETVMIVAPKTEPFNRYVVTGWYWYGLGANTARVPVATPEIAKAQALQYAKAKLKEREQELEA